MARIVMSCALVAALVFMQALGVQAQAARDEGQAKCLMATRFWPDVHVQGLARHTRSAASEAARVACERVVAGVLSGRIKSGDFRLKAFLQGSNTELMLVLAGQ